MESNAQNLFLCEAYKDSSCTAYNLMRRIKYTQLNSDSFEITVALYSFYLDRRHPIDG